MKKRKRIGMVGLGLIPATVLSFVPFAYASNQVTVSTEQASYMFDGQYGFLDSGYVSLNYQGHLYVPVRFVAENTGNQVSWDDKSLTVTFTQGDGKSIPTDWSKYRSSPSAGNVNANVLPVRFVFNGQEKSLDNGYSALMYNDHIYVPARFVAVNLGANVQWMPNSNTVDISWSQGQSNSILKDFMVRNPKAYIGPVKEVTFGDKNYLAVLTVSDGFSAEHPAAYLIDSSETEAPLQTIYDNPSSANVVQQGNQNFLLISGVAGAHTDTLDLYGLSNGTPTKLQGFLGSNGTSYWLQDGKLDILQSNRTYNWDLTKTDGSSDDSSDNELYEYDKSTQEISQISNFQDGVFSLADAVGNPRERAHFAIFQIEELLGGSAIKKYPDNWTENAKSSFVAHQSDLSFLSNRTDPVISLSTVNEGDSSASYTYQENGHVLQINLELGNTWQIIGFTVDGK